MPTDKPTQTATVADRVLRALTDLPTPPTAAQLAAHLAVSQSGVTKALAALERSGQAYRSTSGPDHKRVAATWSLTAPPATPAGPESAPALITGRPGTGPAGSTAATGRLGQGRLRALVLEQLRAQPAGTALTPSQIARALGRSAGAVANACDKLTATGDAHQVGAKPRTFAATGGTRPRAAGKPAKTVKR
jgi:DNA-binding MarR family transcriptional regulator